ncbi:protocatechuate 3,4-dioxygenase beta subunit [Labrenzia sp. EL_142]|nr:protocatechuate 3,4-dioxygenase beta subunit [Labrenzia sp. EL_142]
MAGMSDIAYFKTETSDRLFAERLDTNSDERLALVLSKVTEHLHAIIRETRPTLKDWRAAIEFLTEIGHLCDDRRQEWVLVSDLLGMSTLVDALNSNRPEKATPNTMRGPFYRADAPLMRHGENISLDGLGTPVDVTIQLMDLDDRPVAGAHIETWQANAKGYYENQQPDLQPEHNLRGHFVSDSAGRVSYSSIRPSGYEVPKDGPLGDLLAKLGAPLCRPAHVYFQVTASGFETLTTQIFDGEDPNLGMDPLFSVKPSLVGCFKDAMPGSDASLTLDVDFHLNPTRKELEA